MGRALVVVILGNRHSAGQTDRQSNGGVHNMPVLETRTPTIHPSLADGSVTYGMAWGLSNVVEMGEG